MATEEHDNKCNRAFRGKFNTFGPEPPAGAWDAIRERIPCRAPERVKEPGLADRIGWLFSGYRLYPAMAAIACLLIATLFLLIREESHTLSGKAIADGKALPGATAFLFRVHDTLRPYDSVSFVDKTTTDTQGRFTFRSLVHGHYLVRVAVAKESALFPRFRVGHSGNTLFWDLSELIILADDIENYVIEIPEFILRE